jgi:hypothetical protein
MNVGGFMPYKDKEKNKECQKKYREVHAEEIKKQQREYYLRNKECFQQRNKIYTDKHREEINAAASRYYYANKDIISEKRKPYSKAYNLKYKKRLNRWHKDDYQKNGFAQE